MKTQTVRIRILPLLFLLLPLLALWGCSGKNKKHSDPGKITYSGTITPGDTILGLLNGHGIPTAEGLKVSSKLKKVFNPANIKPGHYYELTISTSHKVLYFSCSPAVQKKYEVRLTTSGYKAYEVKLKMTKKIFGYSGRIKDNLYNSMINAGVSPAMIMNFADVFESRIDFLTEPRSGDRFYIVFEQYFTKRGPVPGGSSILAGKYTLNVNRRKNITKNFIAFAYPQGENYGYYSPNGQSTLTQFLRAPLHFRRISSYFSKRRFHPILKIYRQHYGIDYAAPRGTPVSSIGDGKVYFVGRNGGYGRQIKIKHNGVYESWYAHLHRYARGIRRGARVKKGQVIGYVGMSGLATGPHLDFRVKKYGRFVNFLRLKLPPSRSLTKKEMKTFKNLKKEYYTYLAQLHMNKKFVKKCYF